MNKHVSTFSFLLPLTCSIKQLRKLGHFFLERSNRFSTLCIGFFCTIEKSLRPSIAAVVDPGVLLGIVQTANRSVIFKGLFSNLKKCSKVSFKTLNAKWHDFKKEKNISQEILFLRENAIWVDRATVSHCRTHKVKTRSFWKWRHSFHRFYDVWTSIFLSRLKCQLRWYKKYCFGKNISRTMNDIN